MLSLLRPRPLVRGRHLLAVPAALLVVVAGCGSDSDPSSADGAVSESEVVESSPDSVDVSTETETPSAADVPPDEGAFPVTITHKFGETTIEDTPTRVVSVGFAEHDGLLSLGVIPVGVRDWYGDQPSATWPWAQDELGDAKPTVLPSTDLNFEAIGALQPDLIVGISSGMDADDYEKLSQIAPTLAQPADYIDYGTPWDVALLETGRALGLESRAEAVIAETNDLFAAAREANPEFDGQSAAVAFVFDGAPGAYASSDSRSRMMTDLGFTIPSEFDELSGDQFFFTVSPEQLATLDSDVLVWIVGSEDELGAVQGLALRPSMRAATEGREVVADELLSGAFSHASPLSYPYVLERLVPELAAAADGDPSTPVPSAAGLQAA
jgi:iron complex transport system substrate-binding protein